MPAGVYLQLHQGTSPESSPSPAAGKTRITPAIWEAKRELSSRGFITLPVRGGSPAMIDIIAWDSHIIYGIAVRRSRRDADVRDITTRYDPLIRQLRTIRVPVQVEIQLWISIRQTFQVYEILAGGIMSRSLP